METYYAGMFHDIDRLQAYLDVKCLSKVDYGCYIATMMVDRRGQTYFPWMRPVDRWLCRVVTASNTSTVLFIDPIPLERQVRQLKWQKSERLLNMPDSDNQLHVETAICYKSHARVVHMVIVVGFVKGNMRFCTYRSGKTTGHCQTICDIRNVFEQLLILFH